MRAFCGRAVSALTLALRSRGPVLAAIGQQRVDGTLHQVAGF
jgi:hypothetical protein